LNGVSAEPAALIVEAGFSLAVGLTFGFVFSWPSATVILGFVPILVIASKIKGKVMMARITDTDEKAET
jgi:hypothetical protein